MENYETTANKFYIEMYCSADYKLTTLTGIQKINQFLRFHTEKEYCLPDLAGEDVWPFVSRDGAHSLTQIAIPQKENNEPHITPDNPDPNLP